MQTIGQRLYAPPPNNYCPCGSQKKYKNCCATALVHRRGGGKQMLLEKFGQFEIYRPRREIEKRVGKAAEAHLREQFAPGVYTDYETVQAIVKRLANYFGERFDSLVPKLASRQFVDFLLWQYDQSGEVESLWKKGKLSGDALKHWRNIAPTYRRALKYMAERTTMLAPGAISDESADLLEATDDACICAEELIIYCIQSDQARIFRDNCKVTVFPPGSPTYVDVCIGDARLRNFEERMRADAHVRDGIYDQPDFELDHKKHAQWLDQPLIESIGAGYHEALDILVAAETYTRSPKEDFWPEVKFMRKSTLIALLAEKFGKPEATIEKVLAGFSLAKDDLLARAKGDPDYWNPMVEHRAYRRGMFLLPHEELGEHLSWSKRLFNEAFTLLIGEVCYGFLPSEWKSSAVKSALGIIGVEKGKWFEQQVQTQLNRIGIHGLKGREWLGIDEAHLPVPAGELDFIGWSERDQALVLLEAKMLRHGTEPRMWKNQIEAFLVGTKKDKSFLEKLRLKSKWVNDNAEAIVRALQSEGIAISSPPRAVISAFVTHAPVAASYFIDEFPCIAVSELLRDYGKGGEWPYNVGVEPIPNC